MEEAELVFKNDNQIWYSPKNSECLISFNSTKQTNSIFLNRTEPNARSQDSFGTPGHLLEKNDKIEILSIQNAPDFGKTTENFSNEEDKNQPETCKR